MKKNCRICPKEVSQHSNYCCPAHRLLDNNRYSGESIREALERRAKKHIYANR